jgi:tetratricopeptide (TPR) repeat protein
VFLKKLFSIQGHPQESKEIPSDKLTFMVKKEVKSLLDSGRLFFEEKKFEEAIRVYTQAVEADPECGLCHFNLGYVHHENGQFAQAMQSYEKAIEIEPTCNLFLEHCARLHFEMLDYKEATRLFYRASLVGKIQPVSLGLWGRALFEQGLFEQSIETFERLLEQQQQPVIQNGAKYWLAIARIKLEHLAAARRIIFELLTVADLDHKVLFELGEHLIEAKCLSLARAVFAKVMAEQPDSLLSRLRTEDIESLEKQIDEMLPKIFEGDEERMLHQIHALSEFGNDKISRALLSLIHSPSAPLREVIIRYQAKFGYDVSEKILPFLRDPVPFVREAAFEYFEKLFQGIHLKELIRGLQDPNINVRRITARILGRFGSFEHLPELEIALSDPSCQPCHHEIRQAIGRIKHRYQRKIDQLYNEKTPLHFPVAAKSRKKDWRFWFLIAFQIAAVAYFIYSILTL